MHIELVRLQLVELSKCHHMILLAIVALQKSFILCQVKGNDHKKFSFIENRLNTLQGWGEHFLGNNTNNTSIPYS